MLLIFVLGLYEVFMDVLVECLVWFGMGLYEVFMDVLEECLVMDEKRLLGVLVVVIV